MSSGDPASRDVLVTNARIVTMDAERRVLHGWIAVVAGEIAAVGEGRAPSPSDDMLVIDADGGIVHPGYVSAHQHTVDTLARASLDGPLPFTDWLFGCFYAEVLSYTPEQAARAARLAAADLARAGVTTLVDCWGVGDPGSARSRECLKATLEVARASGLRWIIAPMVSDRVPLAWQADLDRIERDGAFRADGLRTDTDAALRFAADALALVDDPPAGARELVDIWVAPELPEMATDRLLTGLADLARSHGRGMTTHLAPSPPSAEGEGGIRSIARLESLGVLEAPFVAAHLIAADDAELRLLADRGVGAAHCPTSTMLGGGHRSAIGAMRQAGMTVGLGLDNATLNHTADMMAEMRAAVAFDRACPSGEVRLTAEAVLELATIGGAAAIGAADRIGSIEVGKRADLVVLDTTGDHWQPTRSPALGLVFQARADDIRWVLVDGAPVVGR